MFPREYLVYFLRGNTQCAVSHFARFAQRVHQPYDTLNRLARVFEVAFFVRSRESIFVGIFSHIFIHAENQVAVIYERFYKVTL
jgi:hypothetical protein